MAIERAALQGRWLHAHEQDTEERMVFVPANSELPPSRGRQELELGDAGEATEGGPGATDRPEARAAQWELTDDDDLVIRSPEGREAWRARVVSADADRLVLDRSTVR
jgi:hypothetical protein